ncbi:MAG: hypothetical protein JJU40_04310 [Rhodobacteraceae bacterium]|nr:hypothetical protein [Paracoccaceae bacterium]
MDTALKITALLAGAYALIIAVMALSQTALLFPRWAVGQMSSLPDGAVSVQLHRPDGVVLHGHLLPGGQGGAPILGFGGNAWNAADMALFLHRVFPDHSVGAFHYRGYAPSTGRPAARALAEDALAIHDHLLEQVGWQEPPVVVGFSIGAGPAAHLAANRAVGGVILVTPFDSLTNLARAHYPWTPVRLLLRHQMEPAADLSGTAVPVALIAAAQDNIVPASRTDALRSALADNAPGVVFDRTIPAGHNDLYGHPDFADALRDAMRRIVLSEDPGARNPGRPE